MIASAMRWWIRRVVPRSPGGKIGRVRSASMVVSVRPSRSRIGLPVMPATSAWNAALARPQPAPGSSSASRSCRSTSRIDSARWGVIRSAAMRAMNGSNAARASSRSPTVAPRTFR